MTSHRHAGPSRRIVLAGGATLALAWGVRAPLAQAVGAPRRTPATPGWTKARSANGWPVLDAFEPAAVQGSGLSVPLAGGAAATILVHLVRRFHYEIDALRPGDLAGGTTDRAVTVAAQSNHLSGTAVNIRPGSYPLGQRGNLYPAQLEVVRDMLAECEGVVSWGGDLTDPLEGHFQIDLPPSDARVRRLATRFGLTDTLDSPHGPGTVDVTDPQRRARSRSFARTGRR